MSEVDEVGDDERRIEAGIYTNFSYEDGLCPECGNPVRDETGEYAEVSGEPYGRPDLTDVWVHAECFAALQREAANDDARGERDR